MTSDQKITLDQIKELLGSPRLVRGENEEAYWKWWDAFVAAYNPETLLEWVQLDDYAKKTWEQQRLQRYNSALLENATAKALENLLTNYKSGRNLGLAVFDREAVIAEYFSSSEKVRKRVIEQLDGWDITIELIMTEAMRLQADSLVVFDKLDSYRASAKRALLKDLDRSVRARRNSSEAPL
jgi:hypothetical protein